MHHFARIFLAPVFAIALMLGILGLFMAATPTFADSPPDPGPGLQSDCYETECDISAAICAVAKCTDGVNNCAGCKPYYDDYDEYNYCGCAPKGGGDGGGGD